MPQYDIYVACKECDGIHPMGVGVHLNAGPMSDDSVYETYSADSVPPQILAIQGRKALCLKTGKWFVQENFYNVFLKPREPIVRRTAAKQEETLWPSRTIPRS